MAETAKSIQKRRAFTVYDLTVIGVMAAVVYVVTLLIKIDIPTPAGPVMLKLANAFVLLAGMLFGGLRGGLAAGIGSMLFDLSDPRYLMDAPFTLIRFFLAAFLCGVICCGGGRRGKKLGYNIAGATVGSLFSLAFYFVQSMVKQLIQSQPFEVALVNISAKMLTSAINAVAAVIIACLLAPLCMAALRRAGFYQKMRIGGGE